jgi:chorismate mutase / prephenate dehydratase
MNTHPKAVIPDFSGFRKIITLGPKGTFSNQAASLVGGSVIKEIKYTTTIPQIAAEVVKNETVLGVMPIENSTSGMVGQAQDSLVDNAVIIVNELEIEISFSLVSHVILDEVKQFFCHSEAFNQTMIFTARHMPEATVVFSNSNIHSSELFLERPNEPVAAIIPKSLALKNMAFQKKVVAEDVQDTRQNITRFVVLRRKPADYRPDFNRHKTSLMIEFREDRHSLLFELLREFHVFGINLCRLESRPIKNTPWHYRFFIDLINNHRVDACMEELLKQDIGFQVFGSYDRIVGPGKD